MLPYTKNIVNDIKTKMTHSEIEDYFNNKCYFSKSEFGEVINEFIVFPNHDILKIILSSKKYKEHIDCLNEYGEPTIHAMLYAIQAVYSVKELEYRRESFKSSIISILLDDHFQFNWKLLDQYFDNVLHIIFSMDSISTEEIEKLCNRAIQFGVNPLNRNISNDNAFDVLLQSKQNPTFINHMIGKLGIESDKYIIEIKENAYNENEANN